MREFGELNVGRATIKYSYRALSRAEMEMLDGITDPMERAKYIIENTVEGITFDAPAGVVLRVAQDVIKYSQPPLEQTYEEERTAFLGDPLKLQEVLITAAFPEYTLEVQRQASIREWLNMWVRTEWKMISVMGVSPAHLNNMIYDPTGENQKKQQHRKDMQKIVHAAEQGGRDAQEASLMYGEAVQRKLDQLRKAQQEDTTN